MLFYFPTSNNCEHLLLSILPTSDGVDVQICAILAVTQLYLIGILIFIFLRTYDVEHFFTCLFAICISFFGYIFVKVFGSFFNQFFFFFLFLSFKVSLFLTTVHHQCDFCKYFSPSLWHWALQRRNFNINKFQLINYFFLGSHLWYLKRHCHAQGHLQFLLCCLLGVYSFAFLHLYVGFIMHSFFEACKVIHFSAGGCQLFQHYLLKRLSLFHFIVFASCQRLVDCIYRGLFLDSLFSSIDVVVYSFTSATLSLFIASLEVK